METSPAPQSAGFRYGTSKEALTREAYLDKVPEGASGSYSVDISSLAGNTTYYYQAFMMVHNGTGYIEITSPIGSFTTGSTTESPLAGWLELPARTSGENLFNDSFGTGKSRNYSYLYDKSMYTALWVAYPLTSSHISGSASSGWSFNPNIDEDDQINVKSSSYGTNYGNSTYSRGHQIPNGDRQSSSAMNKATYYLTNQTPQIQNGFNGTVWSNLENAIRDLTSSTDTVYVVTGAAFRKVGGSESISHLTAAKSGIKPERVNIPNYYWKVLLKVKRSGTTVTSASAIGIWMDHKTYSSSTAWQSCTVSVSTIQEYTGFDFFANLPDNVEAVAESNTSWAEFQNF